MNQNESLKGIYKQATVVPCKAAKYSDCSLPWISKTAKHVSMKARQLYLSNGFLDAGHQVWQEENEGRTAALNARFGLHEQLMFYEGL